MPKIWSNRLIFPGVPGPRDPTPIQVGDCLPCWSQVLGTGRHLLLTPTGEQLPAWGCTFIPSTCRFCLLMESASADGESAGSPPRSLAPSPSSHVCRHLVSTLLWVSPRTLPFPAPLPEPQAARAKCQGCWEAFHD